ncbi:hypothetical protein [Ectobacillus panaciterrae]|uniref:hypothetical protein n=1 Tax=Ectobacillus panaciterrae TaxID=363872 RepID=UPI00040DD99C|nr:hypothetical protein [Ectobacillus panaciterrae]
MFWAYREDYKRHEHDSDENKGLLKRLSPGARITQLVIRNSFFTYNTITFEGFSDNIALFSGGSIPRSGILRVRIADIIAIVI